jgi:UDP-2,3-diacylglucosamine pyrophosphatase LpxH
VDIKHLPVKNIPIGSLIERLNAEGWGRSHDGVVQELTSRWAVLLNTHIDVREVGENSLTFTTYLPDIRLRTMNEVPCLLLAGDSVDPEVLNRHWVRYNTGHLPFILALSHLAYEQAADKLSNGRCLVLSAEQIKNLFSSADPHHQLKLRLREQIPRRTLIPYDRLPAVGGMFFGRADEMGRLQEEDFISFAIAGPGRMGKTSLLNNYNRAKLHNRSASFAHRFSVSFFGAETTPDRVARFLAMAIQASKQSDRMTAKGLVNFLRYMRSRLGGPIELLLDEVDGVCAGEAFQYLGEAAKMGLCRLVLCGKGELLKMMLSAKSPLDCRLDLIQLGPLDEESARALLLKPLEDLGFRLSDPDHILDEVLRLTGRLPNLIQYIGQKLAEFAIQEKTEVITREHMDKLRADFFIPQLFVKSLIDLEDPESRLIGLSLVDDGATNITASSLQGLGERHGLPFTSKRIMEIFVDLVINNVLVWNHGSYSLANEGLPFYARQTGYLSKALAEALAEVGAA